MINKRKSAVLWYHDIRVVEYFILRTSLGGSLQSLTFKA